MSNTQSRRDVLAGGASIAAASLALTPSNSSRAGQFRNGDRIQHPAGNICVGCKEE